MKLVDIDFCAQNACIVSAGSEIGGSLIKWNTALNKIWTYNVDPKITVNCVAVCPHVEDLVAVGAHFGLVFVYNLKGNKSFRYFAFKTKASCFSNNHFS